MSVRSAEEKRREGSCVSPFCPLSFPPLASYLWQRDESGLVLPNRRRKPTFRGRSLGLLDQNPGVVVVVVVVVVGEFRNVAEVALVISYNDVLTQVLYLLILLYKI